MTHFTVNFILVVQANKVYFSACADLLLTTVLFQYMQCQKKKSTKSFNSNILNMQYVFFLHCKVHFPLHFSQQVEQYVEKC